MPFRLLIAGINWPAETFLTRLVDGLVDSGVAVTIGSSRKPADRMDRVEWLPTPTWEASAPIRITRLLGMAVRARLQGAADLRLFAPSAREPGTMTGRWRVWNQLLPFAGRRWDAIYFPWNSASVSLLPVFDTPSPVVVSCRGTQVSVAPHNPSRVDINSGITTTFQKAALVHCVSEATMQDACRLGLDPRKARIIRPAIDPGMFSPAPARRQPDGMFSVVTVGNLIWVKGHEWALLAMRRLVDTGVNVQFEIIGDGPDRQRVRYTIEDLGLEKHVRLLGKLGAEKVLDRVRQADAFLLSSLSEGISNAVIEAMSCAVPVVTTDCGGMREAVTDGVEGFVVPVRDAEAMATALGKLAQDPALRERMGQAGRQRVKRDFDLTRQIAQWLELFRGVAIPARV
ncbi:MAG TPA: glycosyltransferase [Verrucomicrobiae bacterium]|nr:glycosyltransferase [Verrucomicrobiae bacterium]